MPCLQVLLAMKHKSSRLFSLCLSTGHLQSALAAVLLLCPGCCVGTFFCRLGEDWAVYFIDDTLFWSDFFDVLSICWSHGKAPVLHCNHVPVFLITYTLLAKVEQGFSFSFCQCHTNSSEKCDEIKSYSKIMKPEPSATSHRLLCDSKLS